MRRDSGDGGEPVIMGQIIHSSAIAFHFTLRMRQNAFVISHQLPEERSSAAHDINGPRIVVCISEKSKIGVGTERQCRRFHCGQHHAADRRHAGWRRRKAVFLMGARREM